MFSLESVADTKSDVAPVEIGAGKYPEFRTDVEGELDRNSVEVVFDTSLTCDSESDVAINVLYTPVTNGCTNTCIPAETFSDVASPLIDTSEVEVGVVFTGVETEVKLATAAEKASLEREFCAITLAASEAYTKSIVLCVHAEAKSNEHNNC